MLSRRHSTGRPQFVKWHPDDVPGGDPASRTRATVLGPSPYGAGLRNCHDIVFRGIRGYRDKTPEFTQWGAAVAHVRSGRGVPDPEFAVLTVR
ncbi:hypothetical protein AB0L64_22010 [Kribbella sp. NPDC051936]|uniref:hypothetical protein n=1 Tax=Kribbella sp. NPDC051936 TaxID=3154946 RepID=UPI003416EF6B